MKARPGSIPLSEWMEAFKRLAPPQLAFEWDQVGLQVGDPARAIHRVAVALEATEQTVKAAARMKAELLVVHHPLIWEPLTAVTETDPTGRSVARCVENHLAVYVAHTNWDLSPYSMTRHMGQRLGLKDLAPLYPTPHPPACNLAVFVPEENLAEVRRAMTEAGAGTIGNYSECSFSTPGQGTFFGEQDAAPALGRPGQLEVVEERRVEMVVPRDRLGAVLTAMIKVHPYEEVAYDVCPTEAFRDQGHLLWLGKLPRPLRARSWAGKVKQALGCSEVRLVGDPETSVRSVALCSGSGRGLLRVVAELAVDAFLTGDIDYHSAREAEMRGLLVLDAGHFHTEKSFPERVIHALRSLPEMEGLELRALSSAKDPYQ